MVERGEDVPKVGITRGRFLAAVALAGVAGGVSLGCGPAGRVRRLYPLRPNGGEWAFRSRPDLRPPAVSVARRSEGTAPGYVFVAPKNGPGETGPGQRGPMIVDDEGRPVWFRPLETEGVDAMDFKVQRYKGRPVLTWWQGLHTTYGLGEYALLDGSYEELTRVRAGGGYQADLHEILITGQDTALITIYGLVTHDLSLVGGSTSGVTAEGVVQEIDVETGEVLFEWHSLDHVGIEESYFPPPESPAEPFDYFHINSIDVDDDENLLVSARKTSAEYKIDRQSGALLWRLDGKRSDFRMNPGASTRYQHDIRRQPDGTITLFDNGEEGENALSRAVVARLDEVAMKADLVREYVHTGRRLSVTQGNAQRLPNGNAFVGWGSEPGFSEFHGDGELLFDVNFPGGVESYRAFRFPWVGRPGDEPAVAAEPGPTPGEISVHASWNGATEVTSWGILAGPAPDRLKTLGFVPRDGFETSMVVRTDDPYFGVKAVDRRGRTLGRSAAVRPGERASPSPS
ncbi:MAG: arylsulfotransferase family protein [Rubrobacteraceae bacterium]|nr:arylsulfotransferase family protein [Rubrobacteraceae bacterium]